MANCSEGYYQTYGLRCEKCPSRCDSCLNESFCMSCKSGYQFDSYSCENDDESKPNLFRTIFGSIMGGFILLVVIILFYCMWKKRRLRNCLKKPTKQSAEVHINANIEKIELPEGLIEPVTSQVLKKNPIQNNPSILADESSQINSFNFVSLVKIAILDEKNEFLGQSMCLYCSRPFSRNEEIRVLNCGHASHGKCLFESFIVNDAKYCLSCAP